jgi:phosphoribosylpyrophosphate synthetase
VVSCSQLIGETIKRTADEESVSVLFDEPARPL